MLDQGATYGPLLHYCYKRAQTSRSLVTVINYHVPTNAPIRILLVSVIIFIETTAGVSYSSKYLCSFILLYRWASLPHPFQSWVRNMRLQVGQYHKCPFASWISRLSVAISLTMYDKRVLISMKKNFNWLHHINLENFRTLHIKDSFDR